MDKQDVELHSFAYTIKNSALRLQVSESMVWKLIADGRLRKIKIGRRTLISGAEIARLLSEGA